MSDSWGLRYNFGESSEAEVEFKKKKMIGNKQNSEWWGSGACWGDKEVILII